MKKPICALLCAALILALCAPALADDAALRDAVASGKKLVLTRVELPVPEGTPDGVPVSLSPDGQTVLWRSFDALYLLRDGQAVRVTAAPDRGARDPYGRLEAELRALSTALGFPDREGVSWSPDGRYLLLTCRYLSYQLMPPLDLIAVDAQTGEAFLLRAYEGATGGNESVRSPGFGLVLEACFDSSGRYVYMIARINAFSDQDFGFYRCDLTSGATELLMDGIGVRGSGQSIHEAGDGSWLLMLTTDNSGSRDMRDLFVRFRPEGEGSWIASFLGGGGSGVVQKVERSFPSRIVQTLRTDYSAASEYGLVISGGTSAASSAQLMQSAADALVKNPVHPALFTRTRLSRITPAGIERGRYWELTGDPEDPASMTLTEVDPELLGIMIRYCGNELMTEEERALLGDLSMALMREPPVTVSCVCMSPGGHYALLSARTYRGDSPLFWLVDVETMTLTPVEAPEGMKSDYFGTPIGGDYRPGMEWNRDDTLLILSGRVGVYRIGVEE